MKQAVLLLAHGAPQRLEDIPEYVRRIRGGRPTAPRIIEEIKRRYRAIGGASPLLDRTQLSYRLAEPGPVQVAIYDVRGRRMKLLQSGWQAAGEHRLAWDGTGEGGLRLPAGVYFARLQAGTAVRAQRIIVR